MLAALILKECPQLYLITIKKEDAAREQATIDTMVACLSSIERNQRELFKRENQQLINIEKALCGDGDTTLLTQIQKFRTSFADKQDALINSFNKFAEKMAENNSKALIDALTQVMRDFNAKINEQFGDNFKHLNEAVGKMLEWQQEYGKQVEMMVGQIKTTASVVDQSAKTLVSIISEAKSFSVVAQYLHKLIQSFDQTQNNLAEHLKAFEQLANNAKQTFPIIDEQLKQLTTRFSEAVMRSVADSEHIIALQLESTKQLKNHFEDSQKALGSGLSDLVKSVNTNIDKMMKENAERITTQIKTLDEQLGEELNKSLRSLGSQLASLSSRFVQDYTPLTEQLRKVVQIANGN
jgi:type II secretory pathway predicted ATPase ExeA